MCLKLRIVLSRENWQVKAHDPANNIPYPNLSLTPERKTHLYYVYLPAISLFTKDDMDIAPLLWLAFVRSCPTIPEDYTVDGTQCCTSYV